MKYDQSTIDRALAIKAAHPLEDDQEKYESFCAVCTPDEAFSGCLADRNALALFVLANMGEESIEDLAEEVDGPLCRGAISIRMGIEKGYEDGLRAAHKWIDDRFGLEAADDFLDAYTYFDTPWGGESR